MSKRAEELADRFGISEWAVSRSKTLTVLQAAEALDALAEELITEVITSPLSHKPVAGVSNYDTMLILAHAVDSIRAHIEEKP